MLTYGRARDPGDHGPRLRDVFRGHGGRLHHRAHRRPHAASPRSNASAPPACAPIARLSCRATTRPTFIPPLKLRRIDGIGRLALGATRQALENARLGNASDRERVGLVLGSFTAGGQTTGEYLESLHQGGPTAAPALLFANTVGNAAASLCGLEFGLHGPNTTISHKEASGLAALAFAADLVRLGRARDDRRGRSRRSVRAILRRARLVRRAVVRRVQS